MKTLTPVEAYIMGLRDGAEFCTITLRGLELDGMLGDAVTQCFNRAADILERNVAELIREYRLDHSRSPEK